MTTAPTPELIRSRTELMGIPWIGPDFDPLLLNPTRLLLMAELVTDSCYRFGWLCDMVGAQPSAMSRQVTRLRKAGYLQTARGVYNCLWVQRTPLGNARFENHVSSLLQVIERGREAGEAVPYNEVCQRFIPVSEHHEPARR